MARQAIGTFYSRPLLYSNQFHLANPPTTTHQSPTSPSSPLHLLSPLSIFPHAPPQSVTAPSPQPPTSSSSPLHLHSPLSTLYLPPRSPPVRDWRPPQFPTSSSSPLHLLSPLSIFPHAPHQSATGSPPFLLTPHASRITHHTSPSSPLHLHSPLSIFPHFAQTQRLCYNAANIKKALRAVKPQGGPITPATPPAHTRPVQARAPERAFSSSPLAVAR